jgi:hypothetical protein
MSAVWAGVMMEVPDG